MNNTPFGFGFGGSPDDNDPDKANNPLGQNFDMANLGAALEQLGSMLQSGGADADGPVNWKLAHDVARKKVAEDGDPSLNDAQIRTVTEAVNLAHTWLDPVMQFPATAAEPRAWSRSEWVEGTLPAWEVMVAPIAEQLQSSMQSLMPEEGTDLSQMQMPEGIPPELAAMAGPLMGMARAMGSSMFGMQVGQGIAELSAEIVSSSDIGVPLTSDGRPTLLPQNIKAFSLGLEVPESDVMVYLALRESAHQRLFAHVPWLRSRVEGAIDAYARGIHVDSERIEGAMQGVDFQNPEALQEALSQGVFQPVDTEEQKIAKARLESLLALIEGWVDDVVDAAAADRLPSYNQLREALRRRRASGGPAEKTFSTLIGLEMRPRRLREAADVWRQLRESPGGIEARDGLWEHPDLLPSAKDLEDATGFVGTTSQFSADDFDAAISQLETELNSGDLDSGAVVTDDTETDDPEQGKGEDGDSSSQSPGSS